MQKAEIWLIWLAVMWANLARNIANKGYKISVYNRTSEVTENFISKYWNEKLLGKKDLQEFVESLETPRKIIIMVQAGKAVDSVIEQITPYLDKWDCIIDCWNSFYKDSQRRYNELKSKGFYFIWTGVSGGEEWALNWPSIMPWWDIESYQMIKNIFEDISAKDFSWWKCVNYIWENWAWHFVKMVHNWIEYAIMQIIAESVSSLKNIYFLNSLEISKIFEKFNEWKCKSYLFEITAKVLTKKDNFNSEKYLIDNILDIAWAKWTWKWTSIEWLERSCNVWMISEASFARSLSEQKELRTRLSKLYDVKITNGSNISLEEYIRNLEQTLFISMIFSYAQWYDLINTTAIEEKWEINFAEISRIWQWWCIIRADILDFLQKAFLQNSNINHLFEMPEIQKEIQENIEYYKNVLEINLINWIPSPVLSSWINYFFWITKENWSANILQWLRDFFWAHTYKRIDKEWTFHTEW